MGAGGGRSMGLSEIIKSGAHRNAAGDVINNKRSLSNYDSFRDMIDGGGAGRSGDTFQGGGVASMLANAFGVAPSGAQRERDLELATNAFAGVSLDPRVATPVVEAERGLLGKGQSPLERFGGQQPPQYQPVTEMELMQFMYGLSPEQQAVFGRMTRDQQIQAMMQYRGR
jgi:hypothetical protein